MEERHLAALESQKHLLCMEMRAKKVVVHLVHKHILTDYMGKAILDIKKPEYYKRNDRLISTLKECGPNAYDAFIRALKKTRQYSLIDALQNCVQGDQKSVSRSASNGQTRKRSDSGSASDSASSALNKSEGSARLANYPTVSTKMEERQLEALESQKHLLCTEMRSKEVIMRLLSKRILTVSMAKKMMEIKKHEYYKRNDLLISALKECGPNAYDAFIRALKKTRQYSLIDALQNWSPGEQKSVSKSASSDSPRKHTDSGGETDNSSPALCKSEGSSVSSPMSLYPSLETLKIEPHDYNDLSPISPNQGKCERKKFSLKALLVNDSANQCSIEQWDRLEQLGSGSFGMVFRCVDRTSGREVAGKYAKLILPGVALLPAEEARVRKDIEPVLAEVRTMMRLDHHRVLKCFGYRTTDRDLIIFTEYMANGSVLDAIRQRGGPLDEKSAIKYLRQATEGLVYIHNLHLFSNTSEALLHRDLKCDNLLLDRGDTVKLADFGIATTVQLKNGMTASTFASAEKGIKGTLLHMAPEALQSKTFSRKSDVWSMGCTAVEMLTTMPPHYETTMDWDQSKFLFVAGSGLLEYNGNRLCPNASKFIQVLLDRIFQRADLRPSSQDLLDALLVMDRSQ